ncbi:FtsK/SpoIIIE domain-containing protein [Senegalia massiliensis]|uniref:DNA translocase FtsK n=1 Tax=Senegalia massiliensis TaxID=1720316 RepID=A0A845QYE5_9CLOT|nr:FtsK/SpoIIIE domain-containing protein [Senegalia massiliensis]NBI07291.1 DNA translocase FtsK [Senegalia massiliensis]
MLLKKLKKLKKNDEATFRVVSLLNKNFPWEILRTFIYIILTILVTYIFNKIFNVLPLSIIGLGDIILFPLWLYTIYKIWKRYFKFRNKTSYEKQLRYFLKANNFFENEIIEYETFENGRIKKQNEKIIVSSARLGVLEEDEKIRIRAYKDANIFTEKMSDLDSGLSALLGLEIDNKLDTITHTDYIFKKVKDKRIIVSSENQKENNSVDLPLNNNLNWNILKQPHLLLAGVTGSGKTTFLNYLIIEIKKMNAELFICDPKRSDLSSLKHYLGDDYVASEVNNIAKLSRIVKEVMTNRFIEYKENPDKFSYGYSYVDYGLKPVFLIFDELGAFRAGADKKVFQETMKNLTEVILKGREMGVFVVLSTQQPNSSNIPTELRDNLSVRLAMGNMSSEAYRMVFGDSLADLQTINAMGAGYIFLDGQGWQLPKYFEAPYLDYENFDFIEELKKYK